MRLMGLVLCTECIKCQLSETRQSRAGRLHRYCPKQTALFPSYSILAVHAGGLQMYLRRGLTPPFTSITILVCRSGAEQCTTVRHHFACMNFMTLLKQPIYYSIDTTITISAPLLSSDGRLSTKYI
jgi:hypothetical protein